MLLRSLGLFVPLAAGGLWVGGAFDAGYSRDVDASPAEVIAALEDLDIRRQLGEPGTDPSQSGGVTPQFRTERSPQAISFVVMSGDQVASRMTAHLQPIGDGSRTRVTATVTRGVSPDERTSPAFRSNGVTMGLFASALQEELDALSRPATATPQFCAELEQRLLTEGAPAEGPAAIARVHQMANEMRRNGCPLGSGGGEFEPVRSEMNGPSGWSGNSPSANTEAGGWGTGR